MGGICVGVEGNGVTVAVAVGGLGNGVSVAVAVAGEIVLEGGTPVEVAVGVPVGVGGGVGVPLGVGISVVVGRGVEVAGSHVGVLVDVGNGGASNSPAMLDVTVPLGNDRKDSDATPTAVNTKRISPMMKSVRVVI